MPASGMRIIWRITGNQLLQAQERGLPVFVSRGRLFIPEPKDNGLIADLSPLAAQSTDYRFKFL
ncbi:hypothetical protein ACJ2_43450 [Pantoea sp. QMID2]|nr:hypothetical protein ACJ2_43450 [Pantoea sp. QMID2]